jgi:hypothetical protein
MDESSAFAAIVSAFAVVGGGWFLLAPLRGLFGDASTPARPLPCCLRRTTATVALGVAVTSCAASGLPETMPADSPANPTAPAAPRPTVAQALRSADPLAWPPLAPAAGGHHHHHHGHHGASGHAAQPDRTGEQAGSDHAGHGDRDHQGHGAPASQPSPASVPANDHSGHGAPNPHGEHAH